MKAISNPTLTKRKMMQWKNRNQTKTLSKNPKKYNSPPALSTIYPTFVPAIIANKSSSSIH